MPTGTRARLPITAHRKGNRGVAKKLGLTIPPAVLVRAAEMIDEAASGPA